MRQHLYKKSLWMGAGNPLVSHKTKGSKFELCSLATERDARTAGPAPLFGETLKTKYLEVIKTAIEGVVIIEPRIFEDSRGYFFESFSQREFDEKVGRVNFVQDNESKSSYGVMRGLHFQRPPFTQSKLVRCVKGAVLDVAVDISKVTSFVRSWNL